MDGAKVMVLYINDKVSSITTLVKKLVAFKPIHLKRDQQKTLSFTIDNKDCALLDRHMQSVVSSVNLTLLLAIVRQSARLMCKTKYSMVLPYKD